MDYLTQRKQYLERTTLRRLKIPLQSIVARKGRTIALEGSVSEKAVKDKQQSTFFTSLVSLVIPTWAVLRSLANARKCQLKNFCEKKVRNPRVLYQKHGGACTMYLR